MKILPLTILLIAQLITVAQIKQTSYINLKDVKSIEFEEHPGGMDLHYEYKVVRDAEQRWISSLTDQYRGSIPNGEAFKKKFIREIPESVLNELLTCFNKPVLTKQIDLFDINQDTLISYLDSVKIRQERPWLPNQRLTLIEEIRNPYFLNNAFEMLLSPKPWDDRTFYQIKVLTMKGDTTVAESLTFAEVYLLPWRIEGTKLYDPKFSQIYQYIRGGDERSERSDRNHLYRSLIYEVLKLHRLVLYPPKLQTGFQDYPIKH